MKKERGEEEKEILAQMDEAMREEEVGETTEEKPKKILFFKDKTPDEVHCHKCGTLMEKGRCPNCGHTIYVPMDEKKKKIVRWIVGGVCLLAFLIVFIVTQLG